MKNLAVYKMNLDFGRMGDLEGVFVADKNHVKFLIENKIEVYFGEVLGKHSEVYGAISEDDLTLISEDENVINVISDNALSSGYCPFDYRFVNAGEWADSLTDTDDMTVGEAIEKLLDK